MMDIKGQCHLLRLQYKNIKRLNPNTNLSHLLNTCGHSQFSEAEITLHYQGD